MSDDRIDFISAYCDGWCERCAYTERCSAYACRVAIAMCGNAEQGLELAIGTPHPRCGQKLEPPYAGLGQRDSTFEWLDRAYAARDVHLVFLLGDPKWDNFREDPRFRRLVERCDFMRTARTSGRTER